MKLTVKSILLSAAFATGSFLALGSTAAYAFDCKCWVSELEDGKWKRVGYRNHSGPLENSDQDCSDLNDYYTDGYVPTTKEDSEASIRMAYCKPRDPSPSATQAPSPSPSPS